LKILKDAERSFQTAGGATQAIDSPGMFGMRSVGEVQSSHVHPELHQVTNAGFGIRGWTDSADDFCPASPRGRIV
jgi:hypothetical protein